MSRPRAAKYTGYPRVRFGSIITTYRCNAKCNMCDIWQHPTDPKTEIGTEVYSKLPEMDAANVTGGEPFLRKDLDDIVSVVKERAKRVVISSNGWHVEKTLALFEKHGNSIGLRLSIEGLPKTNDEIRGMRDGFDRALRILTTLNRMGVQDIGFGLTIQDWNAEDALELYSLAKMMGMEFASATLHNSFYFHKQDNKFEDTAGALKTLHTIAEDLLKSKRPKDWFRAYFNYGLMNYLQGNPRLLPCRMAHDAFFIEPNGDIMPCNAMDKKMTFGNLRTEAWEDIWYSQDAETAREAVRSCEKNCWMVGSVSQEMKKRIHKPLAWLVKHKVFRKPIQVPALAQHHPNYILDRGGPPAAETMHHELLPKGIRKRHRKGLKVEENADPAKPEQVEV
ncbi:MAG: radical SAM protein [Planctomycetota bacterium]|nr:MAG: radical SAM protein [Planctomycetota bacterium]